MAVKPKLALIPSGVKASKVYSVLPSNGVGDFDFTRSGEATRINKDGLIETVDSNVPRLNYPLIDGVVSGCPSLLLENSSTNLVTYSEDFSNASWVKTGATITSNSILSPKGELTADLLTQDTSTGEHRAYVINAITTNGSLSFFVKSNGIQWIVLRAGNTSTLGVTTYFDIINGVAGTSTIGSYNIEDYGNGWFRCSVSGAGNGAGTSININLVQSDGGSISYTGDGTSGIYIWGAQLEEQLYATSYIPTDGSATTRSEETCNNAGDVNTFNDSEGVLMAEISALYDDSNFRAISISDGGASNRVVIDYDIDNDLRAFYVIDGVATGRYFDINYDIKQISKVCFKYKENDFAIWVNGFELGSSNSGSVLSGSNFNNLNFNFGGSSGGEFCGNIKQIQYFDTALTDTDLEELTSWTSFNEMAESQQYTIL